MAVMKYREPNQAKWIGTRPGHNGTQVYWYGSFDLVGATVLMPAHATRWRFITQYYLSLGDNVNQEGSLILQNAVPASLYWMARARCSVGYKGSHLIGNFWPPLEVDPTFQIVVNLTTVQPIRAGLIGWEE